MSTVEEDTTVSELRITGSNFDSSSFNPHGISAFTNEGNNVYLMFIKNKAKFKKNRKVLMKEYFFSSN